MARVLQLLWVVFLCCFPPIALLTFVFRVLTRKPAGLTIGFFHPYCDAGGGGERVLWSAVQALQREFSSANIVVYTGDSAPKEEIIARAKSRFNLEVHGDQIRFIRLYKRDLVEARNYPRFTLLLQSLASVVLGLEALWKLRPHIFLDSMGYAFTYPFARFIGGCTVICYTHYPTISSDMLAKVQAMRPDYNNASGISASVTATKFKLIYYHCFAMLYRLCGLCAHRVMVNSSWTKRHIEHMWGGNPVLVYPPCDTRALLSLPSRHGNELLSIAQFRPEKDHTLQLRALSKLREGGKFQDVVLHMVGSCRGEEDSGRVRKLTELAKELGLNDCVQIHLNQPFTRVQELMVRSIGGLHTMWNEHFGIGVVEFQAAGVIPIAHNSGGPREDIVKDGVSGFLATTPEEYADKIAKVLSLESNQRQQIQDAGRKSSQRFSEEGFQKSFLEVVVPMLKR